MTIPKDGSFTAKALRSLLDYNHKTGSFTWKIRSSLRLQKGDLAGCIGRFKYARICIDRRSYSAHRLAWLHYYGEWPSGFLDHINGHYSDNRIKNLRIATRSQNQWNSKASNKKGVAWDNSHKKWVARIAANGKRHTLGRFNTLDEAHAAYIKAAKTLHGEFARF